ncbi:hypothetical protein [Sneathiella chinensis]|uniref:Uncharacterized protein n=1 Tax=Sneathiella chinensis TaxID=349750 RepID=A0ABQ5U4N8_9PROT|nr:hypothetical protein [Sneathiella chinensis]GLQ07125.1 hypothetical protein GCM10007924_23460 [Sneathiella chinensis]
MVDVIQFEPDSAVDLYSTAHLMILHQGENAIQLLNEEAENLRNRGAREELNACLHLLRVVEELVEMEDKGPIH